MSSNPFADGYVLNALNLLANARILYLNAEMTAAAERIRALEVLVESARILGELENER